MRLQGERFRGSHLGWTRLSKADSMVATEIKLGSGQGGARAPGPVLCDLSPSAPTGRARPAPTPESLSFGWTGGLWPRAQQGAEASWPPAPWMGLLRVGGGGPCSQGPLDAPHRGTPRAAFAFMDKLWGSQDPTPGLPGDLTPQEPVCCPGSGGVGTRRPSGEWTCPPGHHGAAGGRPGAPCPSGGGARRRSHSEGEGV